MRESPVIDWPQQDAQAYPSHARMIPGLRPQTNSIRRVQPAAVEGYGLRREAKEARRLTLRATSSWLGSLGGWLTYQNSKSPKAV